MERSIATLLASVTFVSFACAAAPAPVEIADYYVFFDGQKDGFRSSSGMAELRNGRLLFVFQKASDDEAGLFPIAAETKDWGRTWSRPTPWMPDLFTGSPQEYLGLSPFGPSARGTSLVVGYRTLKAVRDGNYREDVRWRPGELLIGRMPAGSSKHAMVRHTPGTFLGEQFAAPGIFLSSGRIVVTIWGAKKQGENWQAGVLISDDDGVTWRYRTVGPPCEMAMRDDPDMPVGFNEQTLFELPGGTVVSLLRARAKLGRISESPRDTWFYRSESKDGGETWSKPEATNLAGTGAPSRGISLPDGSLVTMARVPYSRTIYRLPTNDAFGLHIARSFDKGRTWRTEHMVHKSPGGKLFDNHYNAMNGQFLPLSKTEWLYIFGEFRHKENVHRTLALRLKVKPQ